MIMKLAQQVAEQVVELETLKKGASVNQSMQETDNSLLDLRKKIEKLANFLHFNRSRIKDNEREQLVNHLDSIRRALKDSHKRFFTERRQVPQIHSIGVTVENEYKYAVSSWVISFKNEMDPVITATDLAAKLLSRNDQLQIRALQEEIKAYYRNPPQSLNDTAKMLEKITRLKKYTESEIVKNKSVARFLNKVQNESATLADLNDDVMTWIEKQKIHGKFRITFSD
jgi:hypothetical protein